MALCFDAREILYCLNEMGYRNITAEQLKEFMKDLKRLIKYENHYTNEQPFEVITAQHRNQEHLTNIFDKLHLTSTVASRAKTAQPASTRMITTCTSTVASNVDENSAPTTASHGTKRPVIQHQHQKQIQQKLEIPYSNTTSETDLVPVRSKTRQPMIQIENKENRIATKREELNRPKTTCETPSTGPPSIPDSYLNQHRRFIRNTPTDLYQYYQDSWQKFKHCVPGENSRSGVRNAIRKRMEHIQRPQPKPKVYLSVDPSDQHKNFKRI